MVRGEELKYVQLANTLRDGIRDGTYPAGSELPTVTELREQHRVTVVTVQEALKMLKREGLIDSAQGRRSKVLKERQILQRSASYVAPGPDGKWLTWKQQCAELGIDGWQELGRVGEVPAPEEIATIFGLEPEAPVLVRPRVMFADGEPVEVVDSYYPVEVASGTPLAQQRLVSGGSIKVLTEAGYAPVDCTEELTFPLATQDERNRLNLSVEDRVVRMVRTLSAAEGRPVEVHVAALKADRHRLTYRLPVH
ncbi:GntR family transcriptional regulator [Streptomyces aculeolatus]|uniref:GntR family transcriptional regulator n=1 Tax=Streptomyces aculeolatus TaxID=270689 RepID=UPI001CEC4E45|nr:GntR family transcriptional regulator [Streptomyces aculeolatus]